MNLFLRVVQFSVFLCGFCDICGVRLNAYQ